MTSAYAKRDAWPYPAWLLYRAFRTVLVASAFAGFWIGACVLAWIVLPVVALWATLRRRDPRDACQRLVARTFRLFHGYMRVLRLVDVHLVGQLPSAASGTPGVVLVANHATLVDTTAILSRTPRVCCIAKTTYASNPFFGRLLSLCGFIDVGTTYEDRSASIDSAVERIRQGFHVLVFPEGSRSPEGGLHRFQRGAFEIACRADVPVVPIFLRCTPSALRRDQRFWAQPDTCARLEIEVGAPFDPAEFAHKSRRMRQAMEERYRCLLGLDASGTTGTTGATGATNNDIQ